MTKRFWRDLVARGDHGLWQGAIPQAPTSPQGVKENFFSDVVMRLAKAEGDKEKLGELLADAAQEGRVYVESADGDTAIDTVEPAEPNEPKNRAGRPKLDKERPDLMRSLLREHNGDEIAARTAYIRTLTTPGTDWARKHGVVSRKHAGKSWHRLRPKA